MIYVGTLVGTSVEIGARASEESNLVPTLRRLGRTTSKPPRAEAPGVNAFCYSLVSTVGMLCRPKLVADT